MKIKKKKMSDGCPFGQLKEGDVFVTGIGLVHVKVKGENINALSIDDSNLYQNFDGSTLVYPVLKMKVVY